MNEPPQRRHSVPADAELIADPQRQAEAESRNALRQFDEGVALIRTYTSDDGRPFKLRLSMILGLHRAALDGLSSYAGNFRPSSVKIEGSKHTPPEAFQVPELVEDLCDYVNEHWSTATALHLAAYVMWRLNWIHPFADGNGRTSRIVSYIVLSIKLGHLLPGTKTIPDQIVSNRVPYFDALDASDEAWRKSKTVDVSRLEELLGALLGAQFLSAVKDAGGTVPED
jgi:Fic family protein